MEDPGDCEFSVKILMLMNFPALSELHRLRE